MLECGPYHSISIQWEGVHWLEIAMFIAGLEEIVRAKCPSTHIAPLK